MDTSRRAVEAYWRSRMIDGVTSDEDKVAPVYKLEEVCDLLRTSPAGIVKEVSDYIFKRMDHKSPVVKQKTLRMIKYAVGKSGVDFRREMQRNSATVRELVHYKGQPDQLKGDALNKAVRDTAREVVSAIFSSDENKTAPTETVGSRIQGFGNTNFDMPVEDKKSFLSEVIDLGKASIEQGLSSIAAAHSMRKSDGPGNYRSPNLRRSLTTEADSRSTYTGPGKSWTSSESSNAAAPRTYENDPAQNGDPSSADRGASVSRTGVKTREEKLLDTIVTSAGVRLQPTRDAIQVFLFEAAKLDQISMCHALESKLQSNLWQVRMKALSVLESLLRKKDEEFSVTASYFSENKDCVVKCSESPQVSLREKASKVLGLMGAADTTTKTSLGESSSSKDIPVASLLPDLIDTVGSDEYSTSSNPQLQTEQSSKEFTSSDILVDDLFGTGPLTSGTEEYAANKQSLSGSTTLQSNPSLVDDIFGVEPMSAPPGGGDTEGDPFADVSFHVEEEKTPSDGLFSGLAVDGLISTDNHNAAVSNNSMPELFDVFNPKSDLIPPAAKQKQSETNDLMAGLSIHGKPGLVSSDLFAGPPSSSTANNPLSSSNKNANKNAFNGVMNSSLAGTNPSMFFPVGSVQYNVSPNLAYHQSLAPQQVNFGQQQFAFANITTGGNHNAFANTGFSNGDNSSELPDIFRPSIIPVQSPISSTSSTKIDDTKAFSFISDHLSAARDSKKNSFKR